MRKKSATKAKFAHTSSSPLGVGNFYGSGIRNKVGKVVSLYNTDEMIPKSKNPPRNLA